VPATSANLGPGFDSLALALDIVDTVFVELVPQSEEVVLCEVTGNPVTLDPRDNLLCRAYRQWAEDGQQLPGVRFRLESRIPVGKGFGSSAAAIVAGLAAAAKAAEVKEPRERILQLASRMEGHADNAVAATIGGMTTAFCDGDTVHALHVANHLSLGVALFVPDGELPTVEARQALPDSVPYQDAVFDLGRLSYLTTALIWGYWDRIGPAMQDRLHQPYRTQLIPALDTVIDSAREAGAYGAALSGGGPSVIALGPADQAERFAQAMERRAHQHGWDGTSIVTGVRHLGVQVMD
jgi:homoserine kinase